MTMCRPLAGMVARAEELRHPEGTVAAFSIAHFAAVAGRDVALFDPRPGSFAVALLAAWRTGKCVWLAADRQPATVEALRNAGVVIVELPADRPFVPATPTHQPEPLGPDDDALVLFTSGSTGEPKPVRKSLRQLDAEIAALEQVFGARIGEAAVQGTVSHQHVYGLLFRILWPLTAGRAFDARRIEFPGQWAVQARDGDVLVATPSMLASWSPQVTMPRPRLIVSSGGALPADVAGRISALLGAPIVEVFGSTETGGIAWRDAGTDGAWQPLPGVEWRVEDGQLALRSGHLPDPSVWVRTADRVEAREGNGFVLAGRADRIAKIGEKRVSLDGIEARLCESGLVTEARAVIVPSLRRGLAVVAVPSAAGRERWQAGGRRALSAELRRALLAHFEPAAVPRHWRFVEALPRNAQGKLTDTAMATLFRPRLPVVLEQVDGASRRVLTLRLPRDLLFFDGHFDTAPVVPGVVLLDWAIAQAELAFGLGLPLAAIEVLKFQRLALPDSVLSLRLELGEGARTVGFAFESAEGSHASGRLRYADRAGA